jgi:hypothetical protein
MAKKKHKEEITNPLYGIPIEEAIKLIFSGGATPRQIKKTKPKKNNIKGKLPKNK